MSSGPRRPSPLVAWYAVGVLMIAFIFSFLDRLILSLLVPPIMRDLEIDNFAIGLLGGLYFAVFYALMGLPIGRLADRSSRRLIVAAGIFLWSLMTAALRPGAQLLAPGAGAGRRGGRRSDPVALRLLAHQRLLSQGPHRHRAGGVPVCRLHRGGHCVPGGRPGDRTGGRDPLRSSSPGLAELLTQFKPGSLHSSSSAFPACWWRCWRSRCASPRARASWRAWNRKSLARRDRILLEAVAHVPGALLRLCHPGGAGRQPAAVGTDAPDPQPGLHRIRGRPVPGDGFFLFCSPAAVFAGGWFTDFLRRRGRVDAPFWVGIIAAAALTHFAWLRRSSRARSGRWCCSVPTPFSDASR